MHASLCDMITDLVQNSIEAEAKEITLNVEEHKKELEITIRDNGKGMSAETLEKAKDPFWSDGKHRKRKVGLGLPFLYQTAEATGGSATVHSKEKIGTTVVFRAKADHVDLPQFGNFISAATSLMTYGFKGNLMIERVRNGKSYTISKEELTEVLGDLNDLTNLILLKQFITSQEDDLNNVQNERYETWPK